MVEPVSEVRLVIPLTPPSANHYKKPRAGGKSGWYLTKEATAFIDAVCILSRGQKMNDGAYQLDIQVFYGKGERGDLDNRAKCIQDGLEDAGVIVSDAFITALSMRKHRDPKNPRTEIRVTSL